MKLFKYLHPDRIDVLENKSIRFSQPLAFNDPFEFKPVISDIVSGEFFQAYLEEHLESIADEQLLKLPSSYRAVVNKQQLKDLIQNQFAGNSALFTDLLKKSAKQVSTVFSAQSNEMIGVLSLTEKNDNLLMWSHYADSHRGFCIGFDSNHPFFNQKRSEKDEFYHLRKVVYLSRRPSKSMMDMDGTDLLLLKSDVWDYEQEWRMCSSLTNADVVFDSVSPSVHLFKFPCDALKEAIIGANAGKEFLEKITNLIEQDSELSHVIIRRVGVSESEYRLTFTDL